MQVIAIRLPVGADGTEAGAWHAMRTFGLEWALCGLDVSTWGRADTFSGPEGSTPSGGSLCSGCWPPAGMRRFYLDRQTDVSGTSGTGAVVEGVQFSDGQCVVHWLTHLSSVSLYKSVEDVVAIHGHEGATNLHWVDDEPWRAGRDVVKTP